MPAGAFDAGFVTLLHAAIFNPIRIGIIQADIRPA
jgi:hypothetical protein